MLKKIFGISKSGMVIREMNFDGKPYTVGIYEKNERGHDFIECSVLSKTFFGYRKLYSEVKRKRHNTDFHYMAICIMQAYSEKLRDTENLEKWGLI